MGEKQRIADTEKPLVAKFDLQEPEEGEVWPQYMSVMAALLAVFIAGLHFGWPSPSIPKILSEEYPYDISREEASYITVTGPFGDIFGSILFPSLVNVIGRKKTIILIGVPQLASFWMIYFSASSKVLLYLARFVGGLAEAACYTILPIYIGEVAEPKIRGLLGSYITVLLLVGILVINLVGSYTTIYTTALIFSACPVVFMILFSQMPESPYYQIMKNDISGAETTLRSLRRKKNVSAELEEMIGAVKNQTTNKGTLKDLFVEIPNRRACVVIAGLRTIQQFSGISALIAYIQVLFSNIHIVPKHISSSIVLGLQILFAIIGTLVVDKLGRRPLLLVSSAGCFVVLLAIGLFFALENNSTDLEFVPIVGITLFMLLWSLGLGGIVNLMLGEVFAANIKANAACMMNILMAVLMISATKIYQLLSDYVSVSAPFFLFATSDALGFFFIYFYVLETKGKTLDEIQVLLNSKKRVVR